MLTSLTIYAACRKTDQPNIDRPVESPVTRFFNSNTSSTPLVQAITKFVKDQNNQFNFVGKLVKQIGFPYWNKAITVSGSVAGKNGQRGTSDSIELTYIPFVRDSQNYVNATLAIATTTSDTVYQILCDWQYDDTATTNISKPEFALTMMNLDNAVFGNRMYRMLDTTIFQNDVQFVKLNSYSANRPATSSRNSLVSYVYSYSICWSEWVPIDEGQVYGCAPGPDCPFYTEEVECLDITWTVGGDGGGGGTGGTGGTGGNGGTSGGGNGGGWTPPTNEDSCGGLAARTELMQGCGTGWTPTGGGSGTPPPNDSTIAENLKRLYNKCLTMSNNLFDSAQLDKDERTFTYVINGLNDTVGMFPIRGSQYESWPTLAYRYIAVWHCHQDEGIANRNQCFDGADINKSFYHYLINKGFPVSIITTYDYVYAAVVTDPIKFQQFIKSITNATQKKIIEDRLDSMHIAAMNSCQNCTWQKKSEIGTLLITGNNNSEVSGIKIFKSPRTNMNFTLLTP